MWPTFMAKQFYFDYLITYAYSYLENAYKGCFPVIDILAMILGFLTSLCFSFLAIVHDLSHAGSLHKIIYPFDALQMPSEYKIL